MSFNVPVLFLLFNRPDNTAVVFEQIRKIKPKFLFIAADGPRNTKEGEAEQCKAARDIVLDNIDWDCEVKTLLRPHNLGCKGAVSSALNWFFSEVEFGIILEDDCVPSLSFFNYCSELLTKYKDDNGIVAINGCNFGYEYNKNASYFFSRYMNVWGWATWRREAKKIDYEIAEWEKTDKISFLRKNLSSGIIDLDNPWFEYWKSIFDSISTSQLNSWAFFWIYYQFKNKKLNILPSVNLVRNIGFDEDATHTTLLNHPAANLRVNEISFPIKWNKEIRINKEYEEKALKPVCYMYSRKPNSFYIKNWLLKIPPVAGLVKMKKQSGL